MPYPLLSIRSIYLREKKIVEHVKTKFSLQILDYWAIGLLTWNLNQTLVLTHEIHRCKEIQMLKPQNNRNRYNEVKWQRKKEHTKKIRMFTGDLLTDGWPYQH